MTMFSGAGSLTGNAETGSSNNLNSLMMPLMLSLLEKMQSISIDPQQESSRSPITTPVASGELSQKYHAGHHGLDFAVVEGTPIKTTMSGKVVHSGWNDQGYGNLVIVENGNKRTYYAHLSELPVEQGAWVNQGDVIGLSGNTGNSTGPHLHYEIRINGQTIDPTEEVFGINNPSF